MKKPVVVNHLFFHFTSLLFVSLLWNPHFTPAEGPVSEQLIRDADSFRGYPGQSFKFSLQVTSIIQGEAKRTLRMSVFVREEASLVRFEAPARDKGKAMLFKDRALWFHVPDTRKLIRIAPLQRLLGDASNGDVAGTSFSGDYQARIVGSDTIDGEASHLMELKAVDRKVTYARLRYWISRKDHRPLKSEHYALSGKLMKVVHYQKYMETPGGPKLARLLILNPLREGHRTIMDYSRWEAIDLPSAMFQKTYLKRLK